MEVVRFQPGCSDRSCIDALIAGGSVVASLGLTLKDRKAIDAFMKHEEERPDFSAIDLIVERSRMDLAELCQSLSKPRPTWTTEQIRSLATFAITSGDGLHPPESIQ